MKYLILLSLLLAGCGSNPLAGKFTNRVMLTLGEDEAHVNSMYGPLGIASKVDAKDAEVIRELMRLKRMVEAIQRAQAQAQRDRL